jgi:hypothetical protein
LRGAIRPLLSRNRTLEHDFNRDVGMIGNNTCIVSYGWRYHFIDCRAHEIAHQRQHHAKRGHTKWGNIDTTGARILGQEG